MTDIAETKWIFFPYVICIQNVKFNTTKGSKSNM